MKKVILLLLCMTVLWSFGNAQQITIARSGGGKELSVLKRETDYANRKNSSDTGLENMSAIQQKDTALLSSSLPKKIKKMQGRKTERLSFLSSIGYLIFWTFPVAVPVW